MNQKLNQLIESYNEIEEKDYMGVIELIAPNLDLITDYSSDDIEELKEIAWIINEYFGSMAMHNHWTNIIEQRDCSIKFMQQLKEKSIKDYNRHRLDIDYIYSSALLSKDQKYSEAINVLKQLSIIDPKDELLIMELSIAKYKLRRRFYNASLIFILIIMLGCTFLSFYGIDEAKIVSNVSLALILIIGLVGYVDYYLTGKNKNPAANKPQ